MKTKLQSVPAMVLTAVLALTGPLSQKGRSDFVLWDERQFTVDSPHDTGILYDTSRVSILPGGSVSRLDAYDSSGVEVSGPRFDGGIVSRLYTYNSSTVAVSGGQVVWLYARGSTAVDIPAGYVDWLYAYNSSTVAVSGDGWLDNLYAYDSTAVDISGRSWVGYLYTYNSSSLNISGGYGYWPEYGDQLWARDNSVVRFYGQNFLASGGLILDGDRVLGTGLLSGQWMDGTPWSVHIEANDPTATILAIPEPATLLFLGLGAVMLGKRK